VAGRLFLVPRDAEDVTHDEELEPKSKAGARGRERSPAKVVVVLAVLAAAIVFVVQNRQPVSVHFWFVTAHVHLLWLVVACLALGAGAELLVRRMIRSRIRSRIDDSALARRLDSRLESRRRRGR